LMIAEKQEYKQIIPLHNVDFALVLLKIGLLLNKN
jgi:hypothetical protein